MALNIPLEDSFTDIIGKAQRGLSINDEALAAKSGATVAEILILKSGELNEATLRKVGGVPGLGDNALLAMSLLHNSPLRPKRKLYKTG